MSDQIISAGKSKEKEKTKKVEEIYIPQENVYDQSKKYNVNKEIRIKAPMLRSDLCDYFDA